MMLEASPYSRTDAEVRCAAAKFPSRLGLPFKEIEDLTKIEIAITQVIVIPESGEISPEEEEALSASRTAMSSSHLLLKPR
jgi:hypothetical protein